MILGLCTYSVVLIFLGVSFSRFLTLLKASQAIGIAYPKRHLNPLVAVKMTGDIVFLTRLLKTNDLLWIGEWVFHCSFVLVILRHLRYFLNPIPGWVWHFQTPGIIAGYLLPISLIYILVVKKGREEGYLPSYNLFLLVLLLLISFSGLMMKIFFLIDIVAAREFMLGIFTFSPAEPPQGIPIFTHHYLLALLLFAFLPSHIFAAPFVIIEARKREEQLRAVMHDR